MKRIDAVKTAEEVLSRENISDAALDARYLFSHVTQLNQTDLLFDGQKEITKEEEERFFQLIAKRAGHIPLQYLTGEQEFMGLSFRVSPSVLIPRQDTECLVEMALPYVRGRNVLDLCTGSGCIAISLAKLGSPCAVAAADLSEQALTVAKENAKLNSVNIDFLLGDLFEPVNDTYDVIVSNPPYIATDVVSTLMPEVGEHEPLMALDGKEDGLFFYRRIISESVRYLRPGGHIFFEIGFDQAEAVSDLLAKHGFIGIVVKKDYAGLDRVVGAVLPE